MPEQGGSGRRYTADVPFLSPAKILVILVVALIVLGPDKLPKVAKQVGGFWGDFRKFRERMESEVRGSFPDLPSTETITQAVRSPLTFLDSLADTHSPENGTKPLACTEMPCSRRPEPTDRQEPCRPPRRCRSSPE